VPLSAHIRHPWPPRLALHAASAPRPLALARLTVVDLLTATWRPDGDKEVEMRMLPHQIGLPQHERPWPPRLSPWPVLTLIGRWPT
jgi:hypothetical protein